MYKSTILIVVVLVLLVSSVMAQDADVARIREAAMDQTFGARPSASSFDLIDLSRLQFSHSYSLSFLSGGVGDGTVGMWNSSVFYEFSPKLSLAVDIGVMHTGGSISQPGGNKDATVLPGFILDYHPSKNFSLSIGVSRVNPYYAPYRNSTIGFGPYNSWWSSRY